MMEPRSIVQPVGMNLHHCGYCDKIGESSLSFGFLSSSMKSEHYEALMLNGWRRSGSYFYRPINHKTCCPSYTIRLLASSFVPSKSQKKALKGIAKLSHCIEISTERSSFSLEKFELYKKYQMAVHGDEESEISHQSFQRFLVDSPLNSPNANPTLNLQYGTYHQLYRLQGELIAVGVVDLLPSGLSSVYLFYDPNKRDLSLGKYSAMKEIEFCTSFGFEFYYMGYYIHNCEKMRYKGEYKPSELLCPSGKAWVPLSRCVQILDRHKFSPFTEPLVALRKEIADDDETALEQLVRSVDFTSRISSVLMFLAQHDLVLRIDDLTKEGRNVLSPVLSELLTYIGEDLVNHMIVHL